MEWSGFLWEYCCCSGLGWLCVVVCFVRYVIVVDVDARVVVENGDDCGWWCVLKGVVYGCVAWFVVGVVGKI